MRTVFLSTRWLLYYQPSYFNRTPGEQEIDDVMKCLYFMSFFLLFISWTLIKSNPVRLLFYLMWGSMTVGKGEWYCYDWHRPIKLIPWWETHCYPNTLLAWKDEDMAIGWAHNKNYLNKDLSSMLCNLRTSLVTIYLTVRLGTNFIKSYGKN